MLNYFWTIVLPVISRMSKYSTSYLNLSVSSALVFIYVFVVLSPPHVDRLTHDFNLTKPMISK